MSKHSYISQVNHKLTSLDDIFLMIILLGDPSALVDTPLLVSL